MSQDHTTLHAAILGIACEVPSTYSPHAADLYSSGHRAAISAAAELVAVSGSAQQASPTQQQSECIPLYMTFALRKQLEANGWQYSGGGTADDSINKLVKAVGFMKHEHPNIDVPIDDECSKKLDDLGDDRGQGLSGYWKWGFRAGWHYCATRASQATTGAPAETAKALNCLISSEANWPDAKIIEVLHSCGVDTYPSKHGLNAVQVSATSIPTLRAVLEILAASRIDATTGAGDIEKDAARWRFMMAVADNDKGPEALAVDRIGNELMDSDRPESDQMREMVDAAMQSLAPTPPAKG